MDNDTPEVAQIRTVKRALVDAHKELRHIKSVRREENPHIKAIREIKLADTKVEEAISWLNNALYHLKNGESQHEAE